jgi:hypothetical protein
VQISVINVQISVINVQFSIIINKRAFSVITVQLSVIALQTVANHFKPIKLELKRQHASKQNKHDGITYKSGDIIYNKSYLISVNVT